MWQKTVLSNQQYCTNTWMASLPSLLSIFRLHLNHFNQPKIMHTDLTWKSSETGKKKKNASKLINISYANEEPLCSQRRSVYTGSGDISYSTYRSKRKQKESKYMLPCSYVSKHMSDNKFSMQCCHMLMISNGNCKIKTLHVQIVCVHMSDRQTGMSCKHFQEKFNLQI